MNSNASFDVCGICRGDNSTCERVKGIANVSEINFLKIGKYEHFVFNAIFKTIPFVLSKEYYEILTIPKGSRNIKITENTENFLALKSLNG